MSDIKVIFSAVDKMSGTIKKINKELTSQQAVLHNTSSAIDELGASGGAAGSKMGAGLTAALGPILAVTAAVGAGVVVTKKAYEAANVQIEAETKLATVMRQRMGATDEMINSVKELTASQQALGVVGDEVQLAGAQQLATFMDSSDALNTLIPAMNNLATQQNGVNVTSENMTSIANMMGKAMQGQATALTRVGITMTDAQKAALELGSEQERAAVLAQIITDNVGEMNAALASTPQGQLQQIKNTFGDMFESIGIQLMPALQTMFSGLQAWLPVVQAALQPIVVATKIIITAVGSFLSFFGNAISDLIEQVGTFKDHFVNDLGGSATTVLGMITGKLNIVRQTFINLGKTIAIVVEDAGVLIKASVQGLGGVMNGFFSSVINGIANIAQALSSLPFVEFDYEGLRARAGEFAAKSDADFASASDTMGNFKTIDSAWEEGWADKAYDEGASWGDGIMNGITDWVKSGYEPSLPAGTMQAIDDTASNTAKAAGAAKACADKMDIVSGTLKYIRDYAEKRSYDRYTATNINVTMTNNNSITGDNDYGTVVSKLKRALEVELATTAEGVHA